MAGWGGGGSLSLNLSLRKRLKRLDRERVFFCERERGGEIGSEGEKGRDWI
jgi:hypothetical protein